MDYKNKTQDVTILGARLSYQIIELLDKRYPELFDDSRESEIFGQILQARIQRAATAFLDDMV